MRSLQISPIKDCGKVLNDLLKEDTQDYFTLLIWEWAVKVQNWPNSLWGQFNNTLQVSVLCVCSLYLRKHTTLEDSSKSSNNTNVKILELYWWWIAWLLAREALLFAKFCLKLFSFFFQLFCTKNIEKAYFDQRLEWAHQNAGRNIQQAATFTLFLFDLEYR